MTTAEDVERAKASASTAHRVNVRWVCRNRVRRLSGSFVCGASFSTSATRVEVDAREATARCPQCRRLLTQSSDGCEVVG